MVLLTIRIRPQRGYTFANNSLQQINNVDSSERLETIVEQLNTSGSMRLFYKGTELPLNSSLATHNVHNGNVLETCSSPVLSAVLSAVIADLERVQSLPEDQRNRSKLQPLLDHVQLSPDDWETQRWSFDSTKRRGICLKFIKKVLQRNDRFASLNVPACATLEQLHAFLSQTVFLSDTTLSRAFAPRNRNGQPTLCWTLLQHKLDTYNNMMSAQQERNEDPIQAFVQAENDRHAAILLASTATTNNNDDTSTDAATNRTLATPRRTPRPTRSLPNLNSTTTPNTVCFSCHQERATCLCLDASCPFYSQLSCRACFAENHPVPLRHHHERIPLHDARARRVEKAYCPEFASGGFCVLCALAVDVHCLSLTEGQLKANAQPWCRSNLYDRQARGRSAFACVDGLAERRLIRKEVIPGVGREEQRAKYSLLPKGEALAKCCLAFRQSLKSVTVNDNMIADRKTALGESFDNDSNSNNNPISLIVDTREDATLAGRLKEKCHALHVHFQERALPAGDYIFTTRVGSSERVLPLVIERKTWSDLADCAVSSAYATN